MRELTDIRQELDQIDKQILALYEKRLELAVDISQQELLSKNVREKLDFAENVLICAKALAEEPDMGQATIRMLTTVGEFYRADRAYLFEPEPDSYEALILDLAPYSYWRLGETEGNIAYDYVGNRHGIYTENNTLGMPGAIQGDTDGSVGFNGVDQILAPPTELVTDKITLMAWLYPTSELRSSLIYDRIGIGYAKWVVGLGVNNGQLMYHWNDGQSGYASGLRPRLNEWNFAAITVEPERAILYLGNMDGTLTTATNIATHVETEMRYATALGGDPWYTDRKVIGQLDEAAIFNHTLSPEEVESVFRKGLGSTGAELILNFGLSSEGNLTLSWESEDAVLESAETTQGPWIPVESIELGVKEAVIPLSETAGFYRLRVD